jgi:hypothetical protein
MFIYQVNKIIEPLIKINKEAIYLTFERSNQYSDHFS